MTTQRSTRRSSPGRNGAGRAPREAAARAVREQATSVTLPGLGALTLPSKGTLAYFAAVAGLAAFGLVDWPVAAVVGVGHLLAQQRGNAALEEFGEGLSDA